MLTRTIPPALIAEIAALARILMAKTRAAPADALPVSPAPDQQSAQRLSRKSLSAEATTIIP